MLATLLTVLLLAAPASSPEQVVSGQTTITLPDTGKYTTTERRILDLEVQRSAAIARHDAAWLSNLYALDFRGVPASGQLVDRETLLGVFGRDNPSSRFLIDELVVRDFGAAATVMGRLRTTTLSGDVVAESRYLHVYVSRHGHWWIVAATGSAVALVAKEPPR